MNQPQPRTETLVEFPAMLLPRTEAIRLTQILSETQTAMRAQAITTTALRSALRTVFMEAMRFFHETLSSKEAMPDQVRQALHRIHEGSHGRPDYDGLIDDLRKVKGSPAGPDIEVLRAIEQAEQALISMRIG